MARTRKGRRPDRSSCPCLEGQLLGLANPQISGSSIVFQVIDLRTGSTIPVSALDNPWGWPGGKGPTATDGVPETVETFFGEGGSYLVLVTNAFASEPSQGNSIEVTSGGPNNRNPIGQTLIGGLYTLT